VEGGEGVRGGKRDDGKDRRNREGRGCGREGIRDVEGQRVQWVSGK